MNAPTRAAWRNLALLWLALPLFILLYKAALDAALGRPVLDGLARLSGARFLVAVATVNLFLTAVYVWFLWRELIGLEGWKALLAAPPEPPAPSSGRLRRMLYPAGAALLFFPLALFARRFFPARGHLYAHPAGALALVLAVESLRRAFTPRSRARRPSSSPASSGAPSGPFAAASA